MKTRLFLSLIAFSFGFAILGISLLGANEVSGSTGTFSQKSLYFNKEMLPDHVLYPVLRVADRIQIETASPTERVYLQMNFANKRLEAVEELIDLHKEDLAVETAQKASQYLSDAVADIHDLPEASLAHNRLHKTLEYHIGKLSVLKTHCTDANQAVLDRTIEQDKTLLQKIS